MALQLLPHISSAPHGAWQCVPRPVQAAQPCSSHRRGSLVVVAGDKNRDLGKQVAQAQQASFDDSRGYVITSRPSF